MLLGLDLSDDNVLLALIGAVLAFVAAVAGVVAVVQNRRAWRATHLPDLNMQTSMGEAPGKVMVTFVNNGGGAASGTSFLVAVGDAVIRGKLGIMEGGRRSVVRTREQASDCEPYAGIVSCFQPDGSVQTYFSGGGASGEKRVYRKRLWRRTLPEDEEMFAEVFPDVSLDGRRELFYTFPMLTQP